MRPSRRDILIATRRSALAQAQARAVGDRLGALHARVTVRLIPMESEGDRITGHPLAAVGGKGLFTRAIERKVLARGADLAIHSYKDLPADETTPGLIVAAVPPRAPAHDVLIARGVNRLEDLPQGATLGTCSKRRAAQALRLRPDLRIVPLRGNVETRLRKVLDEGELDATLLAAAGLLRLNLDAHAAHAVPVEQILPAAGQGALAVQCRVDDHVTLRRCIPINDAAAAQAVDAERRIVAALGADCHSPVAAYAQPTADGQLLLRARVLSPDGCTCLETHQHGPLGRVAALCDAAVEELLRQGARDVLARAASE